MGVYPQRISSTCATQTQTVQAKRNLLACSARGIAISIYGQQAADYSPTSSAWLAGRAWASMLLCMSGCLAVYLAISLSSCLSIHACAVRLSLLVLPYLSSTVCLPRGRENMDVLHGTCNPLDSGAAQDRTGRKVRRLSWALSLGWEFLWVWVGSGSGLGIRLLRLLWSGFGLE